MIGACSGSATCAVATWFLRVISDRTQRRFRDRVTIALESHVAQLQASVQTIAHHERPDYLDRLAVLRDQVFVLDHMYMSLFSHLRLDPAARRHRGAADVDPLVAGAAGRCSRCRRCSPRRGGRRSNAPPKNAAPRRIGWRATCSTPRRRRRPARKCASRASASDWSRQRRAAWQRWYGPVAAARTGSALWHALGWAIFGAAYIGAVVFVSSGLGGTPGQVLLVLAAGSRLSAYIGATVGEIGFLRGIWLDGSRRLAWLEDYAASLAENADAAVPERLTQRHSLRARVVRVSGHHAQGARRRQSSNCSPAPSSPSSARTAPARARW